MSRYAVYFAPPPESPLYRFGSAWLGRDAWTGETIRPPAVIGLSPERIAEITAAPRRYGFHATLKAPFGLGPGRTAPQLGAAFDAFAGECEAFDMPALRLAEIGGFLALIPSAPSAELTRLAERAVRAFEAFRAPLSSVELARRAHAGLDARERELLIAWGYPYVLERWQFHLTLTERLEPLERERVRRALATAVEPFCRNPVRVDAVALFVEPAPDAPFHYHSRHAFAGAA